MFTIYLYAIDTLADWEIGHILAELHSGRFFKKDAPSIQIKTVGFSLAPVKTMGGLTVIPDCLIDDIIVSENSILLLPGANTWNDTNHHAILEKAATLLSVGGTVCAICGATVALANLGLLNDRPHTSNGAGFLDMMSPDYRGQAHYIDQPAVADHNLITAGATGSLLFAKHILARLEVFQTDTLEFWYEYFRTGDAQQFFALMQSLSPANEA